MANDAPIIDDFDSSDPGRGTRNGNWGFSRMKQSIAKSMHDNGLLSNGSGTYTKGDIRSKRRSWKDLENIRKSLKEMAEALTDEYKDSKKDRNQSQSTYAKSRREWFAKVRYQSQLLTRLKGIEKSLKGGKGGGLLGPLGMFGAIGAIGGLIKKFATDGLAKTLFSKGGGNIAKQVLTGVLTALLGRSALGLAFKGIGKTLSALAGIIKKTPKGAGGLLSKTKGFGGKAMSMLGTGLKAGKSKALSLILPAMGLGGLSELLASGATSKGAGSVLTGLMRSVLPRILGRIGMAVFGIPGAVAMVSKLVWDHLLPEKWKKYITYRVAKFYLQAIDKVSQLFEWIANKVDAIKKAIQEKIASIIARIYGTLDFIGNVITGEGDARARVKTFFSNMWTTLETTVKTYIGGFLTVFKEAYNSFVKPFYNEKGEFSLIRGIKHYAKAGYNFGVEAVNNAGQVVDNTIDAVKQSLDSMLKSSWNPMNWQKNAEVYVQQYEANKANQGPDESSQLVAGAQDKATKVFNQLEKTLTATNKTLRSVANTGWGMAQSGMGEFSDGYDSATGGYSSDIGQASGGVASGTFNHAIAGHESGSKGYNAHNNGKAGVSKGNYNLTGMTLGQIKAMQAGTPASGRKLFAVGKYQMIPKTLEAAQRDLKLSDNTVFDARTQDYMMTNYLMKKKQGPSIRDFVTGKSNDITAAQMALAREFASIGAPYTGRDVYIKKGRNVRKDVSYYAGSGGNRASMSSAQSGQLLQQARAAYHQAIQGGASPNDAWNTAFGTTFSGAPATGGAMTAEGNGTAPVQPQPTDIMTATIQGLANPDSARQMYEGAKASFDNSVSVPRAPTDNNSIMDRDAILEAMKNASGVNSISGQIAENIRKPTDLPMSKRKPPKAPSTTPQSKSLGVGAGDLFARANMANVMHENAFPV